MAPVTSKFNIFIQGCVEIQATGRATGLHCCPLPNAVE